ncbi:MAG: hypothetical protein M3463_22060 [Verrucomicrobiota bacterium]|nr:hypothetical protein [Verrucomicrobiota bacterium]
MQESDAVAISEFILLELYGLLRNPAVLARPLSASGAVDVCESFREHPRWQVVGFPPDSRAFHDLLWPRLREKNFARRRAYDCRAALSLVQQGVTEFATVNVKDLRWTWIQQSLESARQVTLTASTLAQTKSVQLCQCNARCDPRCDPFLSLCWRTSRLLIS